MKYLSPIISEARGKVGGAVYSKNRSGNYIRDKVAPTQPRTAAQLAVRSRFTTQSKAWKSLTTAQMAGWISLGSNITLKDTLGNSYTPTGQQIYVGCNTTRQLLGLSPLETAPPAPDNVIGVGSVTLTATASATAGAAGTITVEVGTNTTTQSVIIRATKQSSAGRNFFGPSQYRDVQIVVHPTTATTDISTTYQAKFGNLVAGTKISVIVVPVSDNGFQNTGTRADILVAAASSLDVEGQTMRSRPRRPAAPSEEQPNNNGEG